MAQLAGDVWLHCSACRKPISFGQIHWVCSVSTCNRARMQLVFCSVSCWDSHVATLRHRDAWAVEAKAPSRAEAAAGRGGAVTEHADAAITAGAPARYAEAPEPRPSQPAPRVAEARGGYVSPRSEAPTLPLRRIVDGPVPRPLTAPATMPSAPVAAGGGAALSASYERDMLIVISKLKKYVRDRSGMNTSDAVADVLSEHVRSICDDAIRAAAAEGRKTVLDRDVPRPRR